MLDRRKFIKNTSVLSTLPFLPNLNFFKTTKKFIRTAHIGVGGMGKSDLKDTASHKNVKVVALCDVDSNALEEAGKLFPNAKKYKDYRILIKEMSEDIDAVIVSAPDHTHAPASILAMENNKHVYCQKPLTNYVSESREMKRLAEEKNLITQMGIQVHSFLSLIHI